MTIKYIYQPRRHPRRRAMLLAASGLATAWLYTVMLTVNTIMPIASAYAPESNLTQPYTTKYTVDLPMKTTPNMKAREIVLALAKLKWGEKEVLALDSLVSHESGWDLEAVNPFSGACGLFQNINCNYHSMSLEDQIQWGFNYIENRYGTPSEAWAFWQELHLINGNWVHYY